MTQSESHRLAKAVRMERVAIMVRYFGFSGMTLLIVFGSGAWRGSDILIIGAVLFLHNLIAHILIGTQREQFFLSPFNFFLYVFEISIAIRFSGGDESDLYILYPLALIGYSAYASSLRRVLSAGLIFSVSYGLVILWELYDSGSLAVPVGILVGRAAFILIAAWLLGRVSLMLRQAEEDAASRADAYAQSDALQRAIFDNTDDPIFVYEKNLTINSANKPACEYLNVPYGSLKGRKLRDFLFDDGTLITKSQELLEAGELSGEQLVLTSDGEERTLRFVIRSFSSGDQQYYVALCHDVTQERELDEARSLAVERLESLAVQLRTLDELKTGLLTATASNLRSPLGPLLGQLESLLNGELGQLTTPQLRALQVCRRSAKRILRAVEEAFDQSHTPVENADSHETADR